MKTLNELYKEAIEVQDACNLCGVAQAFARMIIDLGDHTKGTDDRNTHDIVTIWIDKICQLNEYSEAASRKAWMDAPKEEVTNDS